ncbi:MAG: hypothetical protein AAFP70_20510 [Calditrichota bacterium]
MSNHFNLSDAEFIQQFSDLTLNPSLFTHEAHLRLAWIHLKLFGEEAAITTICEEIRCFATHHGAPDKYNETVTVAAIKAVYHFRQKSKSDTFAEFITEFPRLKNNFKELMAFHYKMDIYNSPEARKRYLEPDLLPFD